MEQQLVGRWEWQATTADTTPVLTPASTGHHQAIVFDRRGRVCFYEDGSLVRAAAFLVRYERKNRHHSARHLIFYRGYKGSQVYEVAGNLLSLRESDGSPLEHRYVRQPESNAVSASVGGGVGTSAVAARPL